MSTTIEFFLLLRRRARKKKKRENDNENGEREKQTIKRVLLYPEKKEIQFS